MTSQTPGLPRNIYLLGITSATVKRVYLPLIVIFAVEVGVSFEAIGLIAGISALVSMALEVPSGYFADKIGHKTAMTIGASAAVFSPLFLVLYQNFWGVLFSSISYFGLMTFYSGTFEALTHESLEEVGRDDEYSGVYAQMQRWSLVANIILISVIPLSYSVSHTTPFILATIVGCIGVIATLALRKPHILREIGKQEGSFRDILATIWKRKEFVYFIFLGLLGAHFNNLGQFKEVYLQVVGLPAEYLGVMYAVASAVGIGLLYGVWWLAALPERIFYLIDTAVNLSVAIVIIMEANIWITLVVFSVRIGFFRVRRPVISQHLLRRCPDPTLKATYISLGSFITATLSIFVPTVLGFLVGTYGLQEGYLFYGASAFAIIVLFYLASLKYFDFVK